MDMPTTITLPRQLSLPVQFRENIPLIEGTMDGEKATWIFDSGGQDIVFNSKYLNGRNVSPGRGAMGATGHAASVYIQAKEITFGEWRLCNMEVMAMDFAHIEEKLGVTLHGILGFRHMIHYDWMLDYAKGMLHLWERFLPENFQILHKVKVQYRHHLPSIKITVAGQTLSVLVDTGAGILLLDQSWHERLAPLMTNMGTDSMASASSNTREVQTGTLPDLKLDHLDFGPCEVKFTDIQHLQQVMDLDGIIGYPLLCKYPVVQSWSFHTFYFLQD